MIIELFPILIFSLVTSLREVLEAALIIGIILGYLNVIDHREMKKDVLYGILSAIWASILLAIIFLTFFSGLDEYQELFEGIVMFIAAIVLTWMVFWMAKQGRFMKAEFEKRIQTILLTKKQRIGIFSLVFFSVAREGAELVLLLYSNFLGNYSLLGMIPTMLTTVIGLFLGILISSILAFFLFKQTYQLNLKKFFNYTSIILIIFAAGLIAHGLHEIFEFLEHSGSSLSTLFIWAELWNINDTLLGDILKFLFGWSYDPNYLGRFEKSMIGGLLAGLFGWNDNPSLIEIASYLSYLILAILYLKRSSQKDQAIK
ncbi:FTR1 family iron permease [Candidatus Hodarchaeum mangrovi]